MNDNTTQTRIYTLKESETQTEVKKNVDAATQYFRNPLHFKSKACQSSEAQGAVQFGKDIPNRYRDSILRVYSQSNTPSALLNTSINNLKFDEEELNSGSILSSDMSDSGFKDSESNNLMHSRNSSLTGSIGKGNNAKDIEMMNSLAGLLVKLRNAEDMRFASTPKSKKAKEGRDLSFESLSSQAISPKKEKTKTQQSIFAIGTVQPINEGKKKKHKRQPKIKTSIQELEDFVDKYRSMISQNERMKLLVSKQQRSISRKGRMSKILESSLFKDTLKKTKVKKIGAEALSSGSRRCKE
jgi:hypothetical protein